MTGKRMKRWLCSAVAGLWSSYLPFPSVGGRREAPVPPCPGETSRADVFISLTLSSEGRSLDADSRDQLRATLAAESCRPRVRTIATSVRPARTIDESLAYAERRGREVLDDVLRLGVEADGVEILAAEHGESEEATRVHVVLIR